MNQQIQTFLDTVCQQIKYREVHDEIRLELGSHLEELVETYVRNGMAETDAHMRPWPIWATRSRSARN